MHYSRARYWTFKNFKPKEVSCPCCGQFVPDYEAYDALQRARDLAKVPFKINSGHRCRIHNARVGGAAKSMHKWIAFDISVVGRNRQVILKACKDAGFTGFGYYQTFLHVDLGRPRFWYGKGARVLWNG